MLAPREDEHAVLQAAMQDQWAKCSGQIERWFYSSPRPRGPFRIELVVKAKCSIVPVESETRKIQEDLCEAVH